MRAASARSHYSPRSAFSRRPERLRCPGWKLVFFALVFLLCASQLAVALMNWLSTLLVKPRLLPRLDYSSGIASDCRTMVVIPTMLKSPEGVDRLIETLEIHHLSNRDPCLHFALLTDFRDASQEVLPGDDRLLQQARAGIEMLNRQIFVRRTQPLLPVPPPTPLEPRRRPVDGLRAQAGQAHGIQ